MKHQIKLHPAAHKSLSRRRPHSNRRPHRTFAAHGKGGGAFTMCLLEEETLKNFLLPRVRGERSGDLWEAEVGFESRSHFILSLGFLH